MPPVFELRRDPVTGWWSAIVTDRTFEHSSFAVEAAPVEGTHCPHCDDAAPDESDTSVRRVVLRADAFHRIDSSKETAAQLSISEVESSSGSWEILVGPRGHHERLADASPRLADQLLRTVRDTMRELAGASPEPNDELYVQAVQSYGRQAGSRSQHLNMELYAIPQVPTGSRRRSAAERGTRSRTAAASGAAWPPRRRSRASAWSSPTSARSSLPRPRAGAPSSR